MSTYVSTMFKVQRRMTDGSYKVVGSYSTEVGAKTHLIQAQETFPNARFGVTYPSDWMERAGYSTAVVEADRVARLEPAPEPTGFGGVYQDPSDES